MRPISLRSAQPEVGEEGEVPGDAVEDVPVQNDSASFLLLQPLPMNFNQLERSLKQYMASPGAMTSDEEITLTSLPVVEVDEVAVCSSPSGKSKQQPDILTAATSNTEGPGTVEKFDPTAAIYAIPELASLGRVFRSSPAVELTESETEYVVKCVKHIFNEHVVLQFAIMNTIAEQRLEKVRVVVEGENGDEVLTPTGEIECDLIKYGDKGSCYTVLDREMDSGLSPCVFNCEVSERAKRAKRASLRKTRNSR